MYVFDDRTWERAGGYQLELVGWGEQRERAREFESVVPNAGQGRQQRKAIKSYAHRRLSILNKFQTARRKGHHAQEEPTVFPTPDVRRAVGSVSIPYGNINDLQV